MVESTPKQSARHSPDSDNHKKERSASDVYSIASLSGAESGGVEKASLAGLFLIRVGRKQGSQFLRHSAKLAQHGVTELMQQGYACVMQFSGSNTFVKHKAVGCRVEMESQGSCMLSFLNALERTAWSILSRSNRVIAWSQGMLHCNG